MQMNLRKLWPALGLMCMSFFSLASAQPYGNSQNDSMSSQSSSQSISGQGTYQRGSYREITPDAGPRVSNGADVFITADFIWWKAVQEGTDYATTGVEALVLPNPPANQSRGKERSVGNDWAPGFKVGLGLNMGHDGWDIFAQYTWLRPSNSNSLSTSDFPNRTVSPTTFIPTIAFLFAEFDRISAHWDLDFNVIDVELGRNFYLSQFLTMRPFIGLKGTWQDQHMRIRMNAPNGILVQLFNVTVEGPYKIHERMDNWGIGVRGGFNLGWYMSKEWSIYGDFAWTAMWTDYDDITRKDTLVDPAEVTGFPYINPYNVRTDKHYAVKTILELEIGLRWEIWFYDDNYHFAVQAGWEEQVWKNWATNFDYFAGEAWNNLSFHGLNLKFRFDF